MMAMVLRLVAVSALALAACGGDDDAAAPATSVDGPGCSPSR